MFLFNMWIGFIKSTESGEHGPGNKSILTRKMRDVCLIKRWLWYFRLQQREGLNWGLVMNLYRVTKCLWIQTYGFELWLNFWLWRSASQWRSALHFFHWMYVLRWVLWGSHRMEHPGTWWQPALQIFVLEPVLIFHHYSCFLGLHYQIKYSYIK